MITQLHELRVLGFNSKQYIYIIGGNGYYQSNKLSTLNVIDAASSFRELKPVHKCILFEINVLFNYHNYFNISII